MTLTLEASAEVALATGTHAALLVLRASSKDPLAVVLQVCVDADTVEWVFARDLLVLGLHAPTGEGAVRVRTVRSRGDNSRLVEVLLRGREGCARVSVAHQDVTRFLALSDDVVRGAQSGRLLSLDLERELRDLLRDGDL